MVVQKRSLNGGLKGLVSRLNTLTRVAVYVGIPSKIKSRSRGEINNAELLYIHTHGSPMRNIPARPVIEPALEHYKDKVMTQYSAAVNAAADGNQQALNTALIRTGLAGQNAAREWFVNPANGWAENSQATIIKKGSSRPLIDTGTLRKSIIYVVRET